MKIIITDSRHSYASKCTDNRLVFQVIKRNFEKDTKIIYMPLNFMTCIYADLVCYIVNNNIEVILDSKRKWFRIRDTNGSYFWTHEIEEYGKDGYCFKPRFVLSPLVLSVIYSDKVVRESYTEFKCYISNESLNRLFSIELVYAFWEYRFSVYHVLTDISLKRNILYNEQAIDWLIENKRVRKMGQLYEFIGEPIPKELPIMEV